MNLWIFWSNIFWSTFVTPTFQHIARCNRAPVAVLGCAYPLTSPSPPHMWSNLQDGLAQTRKWKFSIFNWVRVGPH